MITRSPLASLLFKSLATKQVTVKWTTDNPHMTQIPLSISSLSIPTPTLEIQDI